MLFHNRTALTVPEGISRKTIRVVVLAYSTEWTVDAIDTTDTAIVIAGHDHLRPGEGTRETHRRITAAMKQQFRTGDLTTTWTDHRGTSEHRTSW